MTRRGASKMHMTALERGLAIAARREGASIETICTALHRDYRTIQKLFQRNGVKKCPKKPATTRSTTHVTTPPTPPASNASR